MQKISFNKTTYFYNKDFEITEGIKKKLKASSKKENSYFVDYIDDSLVIY